MTEMNRKTIEKLAVVMPCYNEEEVIPITLPHLVELLDSLLSDGKISDYNLILVDDGSHDGTWSVIREYSERNKHVRGVKLASNVGHQNALMAGLEYAKDKAGMIVSIDCDMQDDIAVIPQMIASYYEGFDVVYGVRKSRKSDSWMKRTTALAFYRLMNALGVRTVFNHADYRLMSSRAVDFLCRYRERNLFLRGLVPLVGYRSANVYYDRKERAAGESKYPFRKMVNFAVDGITSFSVKPVRMVLSLGIVFLFIALAILIYAVYSYYQGEVVPGWTSLILSVWFVGGCILIGLGVIGEYVGKIYIEVKDRPRYNIEEII